MGDHGGGQAELKLVAEELDNEWSQKGVRVYYVPDLYFKEKEQMRQHLAAQQIPYDAHAGTDDTSEIMYIDSGHKWIRRDKLAPSDSKQEPLTGVDGDPTKATPELGKLFLGYKVTNAVSQIRARLERK
jgi:creatinine amidohydrolase/Fe(II)-dependent formamide hydrolase-like protein